MVKLHIVVRTLSGQILRAITTLSLSIGMLTGPSGAQEAAKKQLPNSPPNIEIKSNLVVVPALVRNAEGNVVYSLTANDFLVLDNGVEQKIRLENDLAPQPLALVVAIQTGGNGARQQEYLTGLSTMIENIDGSVPAKIAVVAFGSEPSLVAEFSTNQEMIREKLKHSPSVGGGSAILDAVAFSLHLLEEQPIQYRKAILLISETRDHGSKMRRAEIIEAIARSNTAIYSVAFSPAITQFKDALTGPGQVSKPPAIAPFPGPIAYFDIQALLDLAINGVRTNAAEEMASLSGGEYIRFDNKQEFDQNLNSIANHLPNRYILSFQPASSQSGFHLISVRLKSHPNWSVTARTSYWAAGSQ